ncbi:hypothetical protein AKJ63_00495 [candidate division MSBL1 archaeon SCGC-AAA259D18]|uniref:Uncharacterized protein n=1 Tax=candidate division MSBL1 archaeon SCGC-AAA259D18 TaxID=1698262 RepID=A0A133UCF9_9EURY|nr:hypothetical protein AKJ63_00495 [candidate division MSBL1 archaeon SCGC-AAA259D18]
MIPEGLQEKLPNGLWCGKIRNLYGPRFRRKWARRIRLVLFSRRKGKMRGRGRPSAPEAAQVEAQPNRGNRLIKGRNRHPWAFYLPEKERNLKEGAF